MEDGEEGATVSSNSSLNGSLSPKKGLRDDLRTFRMDKDEANKNQVSLLRYFRSEVKPSGKEKSSDSMKKESSGDSGNSAEGSTSPVLKSSIPRKSYDGAARDLVLKSRNCNFTSVTLVNKPSTVVSFRHSTPPTSTASLRDHSKQLTVGGDTSEDETSAQKIDRYNYKKDQKGNTSQVSLRNFKKDMDDSNRNSPRKVIMGPSDVTSDTSRKKIIMRPSDIRSRILSRPLFVDAPSPVSK
ncbi:hypothetical protein OTU49_005686, partial [Cherax quadricarinatus]